MAKKRLSFSLVANGYGQGINLLIVVASLPIFPSYWSLEQYGVWLVIYSIPAYIATADIGFGTVAANNLVMNRDSLSDDGRNEIFHSALALVTCIVLVLGVVSALLIFFLWTGGYINENVALAVGALVGVAAMSLFNPSLDGMLRCHGHFAESTFIVNTLRLLEWGGGMVALYFYPTFASVALGMLVVRTVALIVAVRVTSRIYISPQWGYSAARWGVVRSMTRPALHFSLFPVGNALAIQGMTLAVNSALGPVAVVVFNSYRTVTRTATQLLAVINKSYWPEFSEAYGRAGRLGCAELLRQCRRLNVVAGSLMFAVLLIGGEKIIHVWTKHEVPFDLLPFSVMALGVLITAFWQADWVFLMATNQHSRFSVWFICASAGSIPVGIGMMKGFGIVGACVAVLLVELLLCGSVRLSSRVRGEEPAH